MISGWGDQVCHAPVLLAWMAFKFIALPKSDLEVRNLTLLLNSNFFHCVRRDSINFVVYLNTANQVPGQHGTSSSRL